MTEPRDDRRSRRRSSGRLADPAPDLTRTGIDEEIELHLEITTRELVASGMDPTAARREALRRFGSVEQIRRDCRRISNRPGVRARSAAFNTVVRDIRYWARALARDPVFYLTAIATLALGIGASTTIFTVVDTVAFRALPFADAERIVQVGLQYEGYDGIGSVSPVEFYDWRDDAEVFDALIASRMQTMTMTGSGEPQSVDAAGVSAGYFESLGFSPVIGRGILPSDDQPGGNRVVVLSHGAWSRRWGGDEAVIGRTITLSGQPFTIVGVMPATFHPPAAIYHDQVELWFPLAFVDDDLTSADGFLQVIGKLKSGVTIAQARQAMNALQRRRVASSSQSSDQPRVAIASLHERTVGAVRKDLVIFLGAVALLLVIACANVANLFLVRTTDRGRELAVRKALGATRRRIVGQLLTESTLTGLAGGAGGVFLAVAGTRAFTRLAPDGLPRIDEISVDARVLLFAAAVSVLTGVFFGLAPVLHDRLASGGNALKEGTRATTAGPASSVFRNTLVVAEVAIALVLLTGAGLLINSFVRLMTVDPGFDPRGVARLELYLDNYETGEARAEFFERLARQLENIPGVTSATATNNLPMTQNQSLASITIERHDASDDGEQQVSLNRIAGRFFETLAIEVLHGRLPAPNDADHRVVVVNQAAADRFWPNEEAVGGRIRFGGPASEGAGFTVVAVVGTINQQALGRTAGPTVYLPHRASPFVFGNVIARTSGELAPLLAAMRSELRNVDPNLPIEEIGSLSEQIGETVAEPRFYTLLLSTFATLAVILAAIGMYGTLSYTVGRRRNELGIRMALGAGRSTVLGMVIREGMTYVALGIALGLGAAVALSRVLSSLVFEISTVDLPTFALAGATLAAVALLACWIPARRATGVSPLTALRSE